MRQRLLQHLSFAKPLRLAFVLSTLLTLPAGLWAQGTKTFNFYGAADDIIYCRDENNFELSWTYQTFQSQYYGASTVATGVKIAVRDNDGKSLLSAPNTYYGLVDKISINYTDLTVTGESKIYLRAVNRTDTTTHYSDPCLMTNSGTLEIDFDSDEIRSENLVLLIFSNDNKAYSYILSNITFTLIADYKISIAGVALTGKNVGVDGSVTGVAGITGSGKVYFDSSTNTLTLDRVVINGEIESSNDNLKVYLKGYNEINVSDNIKAPFKYTGTNNTKTLTFESSEADDGELKLSGTYTTSGSTPDITISSGDYTTTNTFDQGYSYTFGDWILDSPKIYYNPHYGVIINSYETTKCNKNNITKTNSGDIYSYSPQDKALTIPLAYDGSTTDIKSQRDDLTVLISGITKIRSFTHEPSGAGTLTFKKNPSSTAAINKLTLENTGAVISGFTSVSISTPLKILTPNRTAESISSWGSSVTKAIFSDETVYDLWIGDTRVSEQNKTDVLNDTKISFTPATGTTPNILALNTANITGMIESALGDLTIHLTGDNFINATGTETSLIKSTNSGTLKFETDATPIGSLSFKTGTGEAFANPISGFTVAYEAGLGYNSQFSQIIGSLSIMYNSNTYKLHSSNANDIVGEGKASFSYDSTNGNVLTLNNANIEDIEWGIDNDLTIALNGTCSVIRSGTYVINSTGGGKIVFVKANGASNAELTLKSGDGATMTISAPDSILGSGLYWKNIAVNHLVITEDPNFVIVGDYVITDQPVTSTGTITYDTTNKVLTIDRFVKTDNSDPSNDPVPPTYIKSGVVGLTVKLKGNSEINYSRNANIFEAIGTGATILFDGTEGGKLDMQINSTSQPFGGFAEIKYNKLAYWNTTGNNHTIQAPTAPTMAPNANNEVELTKPYADGSIKYSIVYADGTAGVSDATYFTPFAMAAPGTVTAWAEANNTTTSTVKGKYFGYKDAPFTMLANETKTPELIPTIETGDYIDYEPAGTPFTSSDDNIATFTAGANGGVITAKAFGNATLTTTMAYSGQTANVVILNYNNQIKTVVKVAKDITGISFSGNAQYSSYCNTDADDLTLPNGIKAYAVKIPTSGNEVVLSEIGFIPGTVNSQNPIYTPILLKRDDTSKTSFGTVTKYVRESGYTLPSNDLKFTTAGENTNGKECYILYKDAFVKATGTIAQYRCYLEKPSTNTNPARGFVIEGGDDGSTAIDDTLIDNEETTNDDWYDLQGRRIQKPTKAGIYIVNGKKMIVK